MEVRQPCQESARFFILGNKVRPSGLLLINIDHSAKELSHRPFFFLFVLFFYSGQLDLQRAACGPQRDSGRTPQSRRHVLKGRQITTKLDLIPD